MLRRPPDPNEAIDDKLVKACKRGTLSTIKAMTGKGANADGLCISGFTLLHWAARENKPDVCRALIEGDADMESEVVTLQNHWTQTPLITACEKGSMEAAIELIALGANINARNAQGMTPLMFVASQGLVSVAKSLLSNGAGVNELDNIKMTALHYAARRNQATICIALLDAGADGSFVDTFSQTAKQIAEGFGDQKQTIDAMRAWEAHRAARLALSEMFTLSPPRVARGQRVKP